MYCPKCGNLMEMVNGELFCKRGNMGLAKITLNRLKERFPEIRPRKDFSPAPYDNQKWYCPGCGVPLKDSICPICGGTLKGLFYALIERHPHLNDEGEYY
jgi:rubredoxin